MTGLNLVILNKFFTPNKLKQKQMKIIFLDIDGVLNVIPQGHDAYGAIFHPEFVDNLRKIIHVTGAKIVISSTWRFSGLECMRKMWKFRNLPGEVLDITPLGHLYTEYPDRKNEKQRDTTPRGCEIKSWLNNEFPVENYVILDDDRDFLLSQAPYFVQCSDNKGHEDCIDNGYGLTKRCAEKAIEILNPN